MDNTNQNATQQPTTPVVPSPSQPESFEPPTPNQSAPTPTVPSGPTPPNLPPVSPVESGPTQPPVMPPTSSPPELGSEGRSKTFLYLLVVIVVIVTVIALALIFFNFSKTAVKSTTKTPVQKQQVSPTIAPTVMVTPEDNDTNTLMQQGTSDDPADIEKDLLNTNLDNLDKESSSISSELQ